MPGTLGTSQLERGRPSTVVDIGFRLESAGSTTTNPNNDPSATLLCEDKAASVVVAIALWCRAESEFVRLQLVSGGGDKYVELLYGEVSMRFSAGRDRIGPTPTLRPRS